MYKETEFVAKAAEAARSPVRAHVEARLKLPGELLARGGLLAATDSALVFVVEDILEPGEAIVLPAREVRGVRTTEGILGEQIVLDSTRGELTISNIRLGEAAGVLAACGLVDEPEDRAVAPEAKVAEPRRAILELEASVPAPEPDERPPVRSPTEPAAPPYAEWISSPQPSRALRDFVDPIAGLDTDELQYEASLGEPSYLLVRDTSDDDLAVTDEGEPVAPATRKRGCSCLLVLLALLLTAGSGVAVYFLGLGDESGDRIDASAAPAVPGIWEEGQIVRTALPTVDPRAPVTVFFRSFPGNQTDWISVVPAGSADDHYEQWHFLEGRQDGLIVISPLAEGEYEVRAYFDWPDGGYDVRDRYLFGVRRQ